MGVSVHVCLASAGAESRAAAHALLLAVAGTLVDGPSLTHDESGRPHIPGLAVSVTYTHGTVAVAASYDGPLGVDLEERDPRTVAPIANRWFTPQELEWTRRQPDQLTAFLHLWTAKEAVGKALGLGLGKSGLSRAMPLPGEAGLSERPAQDEVLYADLVPDEPGLAVMHIGPQHLTQRLRPPRPPGPRELAVLAVAASSEVSELVVHQPSALPGTVSHGTRFPVVVRSN